MGYFGQLLLQALVMAGMAALVLYSPAVELRIAGLLAIAWVIWGMLRNPIYFYRRLLRLIVLAALPFIVAGLSFRINGQTSLPWGGHVAVEIEQGSGASLLVLLGLVAACVILDGIIILVEMRGSARLIRIERREAPLFERPDRSIEMVCRLMVSAKEPLAIGGATFAVAGLWPARFRCKAHFPAGDEPERPILPDRPLRLAAGEYTALRLSAELGDGAYGRWLRFRLCRPLAALAPMRAAVELATSLGGSPLRAPFLIGPLTRSTPNA